MNKRNDEIRIESGCLEVSVAPDLGGSITQFDFRHGDSVVEIFRKAGEQPRMNGLPLGVACFPLIPYSNRLRDGRYVHGGREVRFPLNCPPERHSSHGDGWTRNWLVVEQDRDSLVLELPVEPSAPLRYKALQRISVQGATLTISFEITNEEDVALPLGIGLHPYFPDRRDVRLIAGYRSVWRLDNELMPLDLYPNPDKKIIAAGTDVSELAGVTAAGDWDGVARLETEGRRPSIIIGTMPRLNHLIIWAPEGEDFFCVEPVSHAIDAFNLADGEDEGLGYTLYQPGRCRRQDFIFTVLDTPGGAHAKT